jgi:hypothetical protein
MLTLLPRRSTRITAAVAVAAGAVALLLGVTWWSGERWPRRSGVSSREATPSPPRRSSLRPYALELPDVRGLGADAPAGAELELWVTSSPPVTEHRKLERIATGVVLKRIVPPLIPGAPDTALLLVPTGALPDLLRADRYGALSAKIVRA